MNTRVVVLVTIIILAVSSAGYFLFTQYSTNQALEEAKDLETLKNTPESERCIVTIRGDQYDVTTFRLNHPGGNIFKCGEDMTDAFNKQHGEKQLQQIQKYKVDQ